MAYSNKKYSSRSYGGNFSNKSRSSFKGAKYSNRRGPKKDYIDPSRFIKAAKPAEETQYTAQHTFDDFEINNQIKQNLKAKGYISPSPIQDKAIPNALSGRDIIGIADTGTGKTAAFAIPMLNVAMTGEVKALVVAPTRELAQQIDAEIRSLSKGSNLRTAVLIGGSSISMQFRDLRQNPRIVVGTPGRIKDHIERGSLDLSKFGFIVLDEVDRMLDMGFVNDVQSILGKLNQTRQSLFFSATLDRRVNDLINTFAKDPITISIKTGDASENVHQDVVYVSHDSQKIDKLHDLLIHSDTTKVIIFDETQRSVEKLSLNLIERGFKATAIHGGKTQGQRQRSLKRFKQNEISVLVATDVAARGIDVADISHVINYSTPNSYSDYVHRIGRAGRAGKTGYALTFVTQR